MRLSVRHWSLIATGLAVDGGRSIVRGYGAFWTPRDPHRLVPAGDAGTGSELSRPGRPGALGSQGGRQPILLAGTGLAADSARRIDHGGNRDRKPGGNLWRLHACAAGD